mmetsp:Transcript_23419/g.54072  ORF Transcript_23419/g.54072 Transcript_23419/m.54072 type:complete len:225 (+) Transcript_23419:651-1325(+)
MELPLCCLESSMHCFVGVARAAPVHIVTRAAADRPHRHTASSTSLLHLLSCSAAATRSSGCLSVARSGSLRRLELTQLGAFALSDGALLDPLFHLFFRLDLPCAHSMKLASILEVETLHAPRPHRAILEAFQRRFGNAIIQGHLHCDSALPYAEPVWKDGARLVVFVELLDCVQEAIERLILLDTIHLIVSHSYQVLLVDYHCGPHKPQVGDRKASFWILARAI